MLISFQSGRIFEVDFYQLSCRETIVLPTRVDWLIPVTNGVLAVAIPHRKDALVYHLSYVNECGLFFQLTRTVRHLVACLSFFEC